MPAPSKLSHSHKGKSTMTSPLPRVVIGPDSIDSNYLMLSFNNVTSFNDAMCVEGGAPGDNELYFNVPTGGSFSFSIQGTPRVVIDVNGVYPEAVTSLGTSAHGWNGLFLNSAYPIHWGGTSFIAKTKVGAPVASDVPAGGWALIYDSVNDTAKAYYNDAGTLKSVQFA